MEDLLWRSPRSCLLRVLGSSMDSHFDEILKKWKCLRVFQVEVKHCMLDHLPGSTIYSFSVSLRCSDRWVL